MTGWVVDVTPISIHVPLARDDQAASIGAPLNKHFNPRPSCEGRPAREAMRPSETDFNPRPSCEGRHTLRRAQDLTPAFQSTSLLRGTTSNARVRQIAMDAISIHVPLARDDRGSRNPG